MQQIQQIAVNNNGGYVMSFSVQWLDSSGQWNTSKWNSGNYPIDQTVTSPELGTIGVPTDALAVTPYVHAVWGDNAQGTPFVSYVSGSGTVATYTASGTTLSVHVTLNQ